MELEHFALNVKDPRAMTQWYVENLGMRIARSVDEPPYTTFLTPTGGGSMIELYANPAGEMVEYGSMHALAFHMAFATTNMKHERSRLIAAGASADNDIMVNPSGYQLAILRDPWGTAIQLVQRP